jgi:hypothetical protein
MKRRFAKSLLLPALCMLSLSAADPIWTSWVISTPDGVELRQRVWTARNGFSLEIQNVSTRSVHFAYQLPGDDVSKALERGRIHLQPNAKMRIPFASQPPTLTPIQIRLGDGDAGAFWRE